MQRSTVVREGSGDSAEFALCTATAVVLRLACTLRFQGYLPDDESGDGCYQGLEMVRRAASCHGVRNVACRINTDGSIFAFSFQILSQSEDSEIYFDFRVFYKKMFARRSRQAFTMRIQKLSSVLNSLLLSSSPLFFTILTIALHYASRGLNDALFDESSLIWTAP